MRVPRAARSALPLLTPLLLLTACSAPMNRQLQSITVTPASGSGENVTYTATGTYTASPASVSPLHVSWFIMGPGIDPPGPGYDIGSGTYVAQRCGSPAPTSTSYTIIALAPANPNAPKSGSMPFAVFNDLVISHKKTSEDGFIAGTAKLSCP